MKFTEVTWHLANNELVSDENIRIDNIDYNTKFAVTRAKRSHSGKYKIKAVNENGSDEAEVDIQVLSKPSPPKGPLNVSDITKNGCKLNWQKPEGLLFV